MVKPDLNDFAWFVHVVEQGGFAAAGRALDEPKSKLSRRIAQLEEQLGVRLIQRTTRQFNVTEVGQTFYEHCKAMLVEAQAAQDAIAALQVEPRGVVKLTCPVTLLHVHVGPMLAKFMARYPDVTLQLEATNRRVDVVGEGVDIAIRVRPRPIEDSDLVMRVLASVVCQPGADRMYGYPYGAVGIKPLARTESLGRQTYSSLGTVWSTRGQSGSALYPAIYHDRHAGIARGGHRRRRCRATSHLNGERTACGGGTGCVTGRLGTTKRGHSRGFSFTQGIAAISQSAGGFSDG